MSVAYAASAVDKGFPSPPWLALVVLHRHEKQVARILRSKGYEEFVPLYRSRHRHAGRFRDVDLPIFPTYVFCRCDPAFRLPLLQTPGVRSIVCVGGRPAAVDEGELLQVRRLTEAGYPVEPVPFMRSGDHVRVVEGPLAGAEGIVLVGDGECRLVVSINLLQRSISVSLDRCWVKPAQSVQG